MADTLVWFFGHPEVYVLILPAFGILSHAVVYRNRWNEYGGFFGMCWAIAGIGVVGCVVWAHHIFTVGIDVDTRNYFTAATMVIGVPTRVKIFSWLSMMIGRQSEFEALTSWIVGFLWLFTVGGVTGITLSNNSVDLMIHDTYFVVAHFHYVLSMSATYGVVLGFLYWVGMFSFSDRSNGLHIVFFFLLFLRVNLVFFPIHEIGLDRLPRRYFSYIDIFGRMCMLVMLGILFTVRGWRSLMVLLMVNTNSLRGFSDYGEDWVYRSGVPMHTYMEHLQNLLELSPWSLCMAISLVSMMVNFICMFRLKIIPWSSLLVCVIVGYFWGRDVTREASLLRKHSSIITRSIMVSFSLFVFSEVLFFSRFFAAIGYNLYCGELGREMSRFVNLLDPLGLPILNTFLLVSSGVICTWKHEVFKTICINKGIELGLLLRRLFMFVQYVEFSGSDFGISDGLYRCTFFRLTRFHGFHVVVGMSLLLIILSRFYGNQLGLKGVGVDTGMVYWHLVDVIWIIVVIVVYRCPLFVL
jgi:heme/copper-type cytochrome/quinol oxidase subunit 3